MVPTRRVNYGVDKKVAKVLIAKDDGINFQNKKMDDLDKHIEGTINIYISISTHEFKVPIQIV